MIKRLLPLLLLLTGCAHRPILLHCRVNPGEACFYQRNPSSLVCTNGNVWIWRSCE